MPAVVLLALGGCGTFMNVGAVRCAPYSHPQIYGGVQFDVEYEISRGSAEGLMIGILDLPLSLVADTLTLPITIAAEIRGK
jgi:uncharacterized protein YceK